MEHRVFLYVILWVIYNSVKYIWGWDLRVLFGSTWDKIVYHSVYNQDLYFDRKSINKFGGYWSELCSESIVDRINLNWSKILTVMGD